MTISLQDGARRAARHNDVEPWTVHLVDTGEATLTGGRLQQLRAAHRRRHVHADLRRRRRRCAARRAAGISSLARRLVTLTAVRPPARFGALEFDGDRIRHFKEKSTLHEGWINGGFSVVEPAALEYIDVGRDVGARAAGDAGARRAADRLPARRFWQCMDTLRDLRYSNGCGTRAGALEDVAMSDTRTNPLARDLDEVIEAMGDCGTNCGARASSSRAGPGSSAAGCWRRSCGRTSAWVSARRQSF